MTQDELLDFYTTPGLFTGLQGFADQVDHLPSDAGLLARIVQGLLIHEGLAAAYGVSMSPARVAEKQLHSAAAMLTQAKRLDGRTVTDARDPENRVVGVCRHFATLFVALMRHKSIPARVRCGFAAYFAPGKYVDHWVGEYWNAAQQRWILVDAQVDDVQRKLFGLSIDTLDVPRDQFLVGGEAWLKCREGADPMTFGIAGTQMWGLVEVYGDLFQDLAAIQNMELLPWGWYGLALDETGMSEVALLDQLAEISRQADASALNTLRQLITADARLGVPDASLDAIMIAERAAMAST